MLMREAERKANGIVWSKDQEKRDDWPRAWKWLDPVFGDVDPRTVQPEHFLTVVNGKAVGLLPLIEEKVSRTERHRVVKVWRALWKRMAAMGYCNLKADPSMAFSNSAPEPRRDRWQHHEVLELVQIALDRGKNGMAALMAVIWDSCFRRAMRAA